MRSSMVTVAPIRPSNSTVVVTSFRCGTFATTTGSSASSAPASMGSVAFLAPEMRTSPSSGTPPWICNLSMSAPRAELFGCQRLDGQGVNGPTHLVAQCPVDELVTGDAALAGKLRRNNACREMSIVVRFHMDVGAGQAGTDQLCDLFRIHG